MQERPSGQPADSRLLIRGDMAGSRMLLSGRTLASPLKCPRQKPQSPSPLQLRTPRRPCSSARVMLQEAPPCSTMNPRIALTCRRPSGAPCRTGRIAGRHGYQRPLGLQGMDSLQIWDVLMAASFLTNAVIGSMAWREFLKLKRAVVDLRSIMSKRRNSE